MFKLQSNRIVKSWPCIIDVVIDGGKTESVNCTLDFKILSAPEMEELTGKSDTEYLSQVIVGWDDIADGDGNQLPFTPENLAMACEFIPFCIGAIDAHKNATSGAIIKNLRARHATG